MTRLPRVTGKEILRALQRAGFEVVRVSGSHYHLSRPGRPLVTVPVHAGEVLSPIVVKSILNQAGLTVEELIDLL
ncbi:MAG: type II toxin-antitoxin system HicA family toxin [Bacillota bacterium]|uniref:type II toxin-antitoxin system HicA family toxin n=1 Tax=Desulfurispora thermophila TaxID=265470 RepID=UPI0009FC8519|nr:type II toxin-antitoxin system HicA family toxin [Desulfurispora thermophila]